MDAPVEPIFPYRSTSDFLEQAYSLLARDDLFGKDLLPKGQNDLGVVRDVPSSMTDAEIILARTENGFKPCAARRF